jgi:hypothetical protein
MDRSNGFWDKMKERYKNLLIIYELNRLYRQIIIIREYLAFMIVKVGRKNIKMQVIST